LGHSIRQKCREFYGREFANSKGRRHPHREEAPTKKSPPNRKEIARNERGKNAVAVEKKEHKEIPQTKKHRKNNILGREKKGKSKINNRRPEMKGGELITENALWAGAEKKKHKVQ